MSLSLSLSFFFLDTGPDRTQEVTLEQGTETEVDVPPELNDMEEVVQESSGDWHCGIPNVFP